MKFKNISFGKLICTILFFSTKSVAVSPDSVSGTTKSYSFRPQLTVNLLSIGRNQRNTIRSVSDNDLNYRFQEFSMSGYVPLYEKKYAAGTKNASPTLTLLFAGSFSSSNSFFQFVDTKPIFRISAGIRALYYSGNKNIWMLSFSPFLSEEGRTIKSSVPRFFSSVLYTRMVNEYFSYRLGLTYTYIYNGGALLPLIGFRVGDYQKVFFNFQIPKDISLIWTINNHWQTGIFTRLSGGIYRFYLDEKLPRFNDRTGNITLYRTDLLTGFMVNYSPNSQLYFSLNAGVASRRDIHLTFSNKIIPDDAYVTGRASTGPFINFSVAVFFGKPTYNGAYNQLIEQKAVNNTFDAGDFNIGNNQITQDMNKVSTKDITKKDLKKINDQYMDVKDFLLDD